MKGLKFEDVDVLHTLAQIVEIHTKHYREDFDQDKELIRHMAESPESEDKNLLWMSRICGIYCLSEREVYLQGSSSNRIWNYYHEQTNDTIMAYALQLKGIQDGKVTGSIYTMDYHEHVECLKSLTCPITRVAVWFQDGTETIIPHQSYNRQMTVLKQAHGLPEAIRFLPENERELAVILRRERMKRDYHAEPGVIGAYLDSLKQESFRGRMDEARKRTAALKGRTGSRSVMER